MTKLRELYEDHHKISIEGKEIHHIIPRHSGGTDVIDNLIALSPEEHSKAHLIRYKELGDFRDLCAYYMICYNFSEAHRISSSEGGKIGGKKVYESNVGIFRSNEERKSWAAMGGQAGSRSQIKNKIGIHGQSREERLKLASIGGKKSFINDPERHRKMSIRAGKIGGKGNKGFIWINDGRKKIKYTKKMQEITPIEEYLEKNPTIKKGTKLYDKIS